MGNPTLVVMAAGMGSRYGGLKQIDPVSKNGNIIMDYSIFDAHKAGFRDVVFIIKEELQDIFEEVVGEKTRKFMNVKYAFQSTKKYGNGRVLPERTKPLGTGHAILCIKDVCDTPFVAINADDYYGPEAFKLIYDFLSEKKDASYEYAMVGYNVENTLTENGYVSRGVCATDEQSNLTDIVERLEVGFIGGEPAYTEDKGETHVKLPFKTPVSMNMWGFTSEFLDEVEAEFEKFLDVKLPTNEMKAEFLLPEVVDNLIKKEKASVKVLKTDDKWYGVTYKEDKPVIEQAILEKTEQGFYDGI